MQQETGQHVRRQLIQGVNVIHISSMLVKNSRYHHTLVRTYENQHFENTSEVFWVKRYSAIGHGWWREGRERCTQANKEELADASNSATLE